MGYPEFKLCGPFSGSSNIGASKWLKKYEWEWNATESTTIDPRLFFEGLEIVLTGEAASWAERTVGIPELFEQATDESKWYVWYLRETESGRLQLPPYETDSNNAIIIHYGEVFCRVPDCSKSLKR